MPAMDPVKYKNCLYVSFDLDVTGKRMLDEMLNIGVYGTDTSFKQYVLPHRQVSYLAKKRHLLLTTNKEKFRVLLDLSTKKILKTKTEIFALFDFLTYLEKLNKNKEKVVLMYFEQVKFIPLVLIKALKRYELLDRFKSSVKGFANCHAFVSENCAPSILILSLNTLANILLDRETQRIHDALERAKLVFEIVSHLCEGSSLNKPDLANYISPHVETIEQLELELEAQNDMLSQQNKLKPIFGHMIKNHFSRRKAIRLRTHLASANIDYTSIRSAFQKKLEMRGFLEPKLPPDILEKDFEELLSTINDHFQKLSIFKKTRQIKNTNRKSNNSNQVDN